MGVLELVQDCFKNERVYYSMHARHEMHAEPLGLISDAEVVEAVMAGEIIEEYPQDKPYPSVLVYGKTNSKRHLHIVSAFDAGEKIAIIITVYEPNPELWIDYRRRRV